MNVVNSNNSLLRTEEYVVTIPLKHPRLTCTNSEVCRVPVCHDICSPTERTIGLIEDILGRLEIARSLFGIDDDAIFCKKLSWTSGTCRTCGCNNDFTFVNPMS